MSKDCSASVDARDRPAREQDELVIGEREHGVRRAARRPERLSDRGRVCAGPVDVDAVAVADLPADGVMRGGRGVVVVTPSGGRLVHVGDVLNARAGPPFGLVHHGELCPDGAAFGVEACLQLACLLPGLRLPLTGSCSRSREMRSW